MTYSDGGGVVTAARKPVVGAARIAQFLTAVTEKSGQGIDVAFGEWNGSDAAFITRDGRPVSVATIDVSERGIERVFIVLNPQKLNG